MTIGFTGGLINANGTYIKPENISFFEKNDQGGTTIHMNSTGNMQLEWQTVRIDTNHSPEKVADAIIKAEQTGELIDINA